MTAQYQLMEAGVMAESRGLLHAQGKSVRGE